MNLQDILSAFSKPNVDFTLQNIANLPQSYKETSTRLEDIPVLGPLIAGNRAKAKAQKNLDQQLSTALSQYGWGDMGLPTTQAAKYSQLPKDLQNFVAQQNLMAAGGLSGGLNQLSDDALTKFAQAMGQQRAQELSQAPLKAIGQKLLGGGEKSLAVQAPKIQPPKGVGEVKNPYIKNPNPIDSIRDYLFDKNQMIKQGADGSLDYAVKQEIPLSKITGREPAPSMESYKPGREIKAPIEVEYNPATDEYSAFSGNHRIIQAERNGQDTIIAFVKPSDGDFFGLSQGKGLTTPQPPKGVGGVKFNYAPATNLTNTEKIVESDFAQQISSNPQKALDEYEQRFGNVLNTDNARELSPYYQQSRETMSRAVHEPASALVKAKYNQMLSNPPKQGQTNTVVFTAGGTGAGKTSGIMSDEKLAELYNSAQIVYDTNTANFSSATKKIDQALKNDKNVAMIYTYRDPIESYVNGAVPRSTRIGRTVPIQEHANTHIGSLETIKKLKEKYANNKNVKIYLVDNTNGRGGARLIPIDSINNYEISDNKQTLIDKLQNITEGLYARGQINQAQYEGFSGKR